ncbi:MAG TPA: VWA domain-containing protein [Bryobacteraceae bacterium]|jgi:VWFA-related protein
MKLTRILLSFATVSLALQAQQTPATVQPRLLCMFFDMNTMDASAQSTALENAIKFVQNQLTPVDRIEIMTYTSKLNILQDFTDNRDSLLAVLQSIMPANSGDAAVTADRQLAAIEEAANLLGALPEKKAMIYFSSGIPKNGIDNQAQLRAATAAAVRANVSIYAVDSRGLAAAPPR